MAFAGNVDELALLQTVRLKQTVTAEVIAAHLGVSVASGRAAFDALVAQGKAKESGDGISLTDAGAAELTDQLDAERLGCPLLGMKRIMVPPWLRRGGGDVAALRLGVTGQ